MNTHPCCRAARGSGDKAPRPASRLRRGGEILGWALPSATLVLIPKCPVCVAAYVAVFAGVGISVSTAACLRTALLVLSMTLLLYLACKRLSRSRSGSESSISSHTG